MRMLLFLMVVILTTTPSFGAAVWLSSSGTIGSGSSPPSNFGSIPQVFYSPNENSGSLYVWARPDAGKTLEDWSLRVVSENTSILSFSGSQVEAYNPSLGGNTARWEYVNEPTGSGSQLADLQGFSVANELRTGIGIGPNGTGTVYTDPYYDATNNSWLLGRIDFSLEGMIGKTELSLQIGAAGINNVGETSSATSVVFGALTDAPLNGASHRLVSSATADAVILVADADFDADGDADGRDFLTWQRGFGINGGATPSQGDATNDGAVNGEDLGAWQSQYGNSPSILSSSTAIVTVPEPGAVTLIALLSFSVFVSSRKRNSV